VLLQMALAIANGSCYCKWLLLFQMAFAVANGSCCCKWRILLHIKRVIHMVYTAEKDA
jgi:hypothetical protein